MLTGTPCKAAISITDFDVAFTENFDTLASSATSSLLPTGWAFAESGTDANTTYTGGTGSSNVGDTYSFGSASSTERALGGLRTGSLVPTFGVEIGNGTTSIISEFTISYVGEQWRFGGTGSGRGSDAPDRLDFQYSLDATSLITGDWIDFDQLDFSSPVFSGGTGLLDGNANANRTALSATLGGLSLDPNASIWLRWVDFNVTGFDDGLAVDNFSITAVPESPRWGTLSAVCLGALFCLTFWREHRSSLQIRRT